MKKKFTIRPLENADRNTWIEMWHEYLKFYQESLPEDVTTNTLNMLLSNEKNNGCLVACNEKNHPIGFLTYVLHFSTWNKMQVCYLNDLFVHEKYRKSGAAKLLLNSLKEMRSSLNFSRIYWLTKPDNNIARTFYDKIAHGQEWIRYAMD